MRIAQVIPHFTKGGAEKLAREIHKFLLATGHDSHLLALSGPGIATSGCVALGSPHPRSPVSAWRLRQWLRQQQQTAQAPQIIHTHLLPDQMWTPLAVRGLARRPILVKTEHSNTSRLRDIPLGRRLDQYLYSPYRQIFCVSSAVQTSLQAWLPGMADKMTTIHNGIDLDLAVPWQGSPAGTPSRILSVGRLSPLKNQTAMIAAMAHLSDLPAELWIVGDGPLRKRLATQITDLGLQDRVRLTGWRDDIQSLLATSDIFLMASGYEGFGLAAAEAMAAGVPVVATNIAPFREVLGTDQNCAMLVEPGSPVAIADALRCLLTDPQRARTMGQNGIRRAQNYSLTTMLQTYAAAYSHLITQARQP